MKKARFDRKLVLGKETLVTLESAELKGVAGGVTPVVFVGGVAAGWALSRAFCR
jgi:hypothetical protein